MNIAQLAAINIGKSIVEEQKKDSGSLPESTKTSIIENVREYESGKYTGPSFVPFTPVSTKTTFTRDEAIKHVDRSILGLQTQQSYNQWIQGRLGEQRKNIDLDSKYMVNVDGREVETSGRGAHVYLFFQNIRARQQERRIKSAIHEAKGFRSTLRGYEKYGTTVTKTDRGWDIVFDPKEWERGEDARARRDWDFGYMIGTPVSRLLSRGNYIMESLRSGSYTPETGLVIGGEKLHPSNFGEDSSILSRGHYDYYKSDWGERFAKGITSEPVLMLVTGGVGAGVSAVGYSGLGATTVSVGSRAITGSTIARGAVTAGFVGMGAYGTYSTYQQDGIEAVEEQIKRAGVMSPLFIGAYQTGSGYGGQLAYKGYQFTQKYNIPSHPFRSGWSNIGKFTPAPIKNLYSDYNIAKSDFVNMGRMARVGSNWKPTITQRITGPFKSTFYRIGTRVKPVIESGWNKFRYHTMESSWRDYTLSKRANQMGGRGPRDFYTMKPSGSYGPHDSISWKPMASQREIMTSYEQLKARPIDRLGAQSPSKWGAYGTSWEAYRMIGPDFRYSMRPPVTSMYPSRDFLKPGGVQIDFAPSLKTKFNMKFYHSIDDLGLPSSELDTRVLGGYNQTTGVFETKTRLSRIAQNPKTLERVQVPAKRTVKFKMGRLMKENLSVPVTESSEVE